MLQSYQIETLEQVKAVADPLRIKIMWEIYDEAKTGKMIGDILDMPASKVHYHLRELEKNGLIVVERTEEKNGIVQKFYRPIAKRLQVESSLISPELVGDLDHAMLEVYYLSAKKLIHHIDTADIEVFKENNLEEIEFKKMILTEDQQKQLAQKFNELQDLLLEFEKNQPQNGVEFVIQYEAFPYRKK